MAEIIGTNGKPIQRARPKRAVRPEAERVALFAEQTLIETHGHQPWIHQAVEVVRHGLDSAIGQFFGRDLVQANADRLGGGHGYTQPARTREELLSDPQVQKLIQENSAAGQGRGTPEPRAPGSSGAGSSSGEWAL